MASIFQDTSFEMDLPSTSFLEAARSVAKDDGTHNDDGKAIKIEKEEEKVEEEKVEEEKKEKDLVSFDTLKFKKIVRVVNIFADMIPKTIENFKTKPIGRDSYEVLFTTLNYIFTTDYINDKKFRDITNVKKLIKKSVMADVIDLNDKNRNVEQLLISDISLSDQQSTNSFDPKLFQNFSFVELMFSSQEGIIVGGKLFNKMQIFCENDKRYYYVIILDIFKKNPINYYIMHFNVYGDIMYISHNDRNDHTKNNSWYGIKNYQESDMSLIKMVVEKPHIIIECNNIVAMSCCALISNKLRRISTPKFDFKDKEFLEIVNTRMPYPDIVFLQSMNRILITDTDSGWFLLIRLDEEKYIIDKYKMVRDNSKPRGPHIRYWLCCKKKLPINNIFSLETLDLRSDIQNGPNKTGYDYILFNSKKEGWIEFKCGIDKTVGTGTSGDIGARSLYMKYIDKTIGIIEINVIKDYWIKVEVSAFDDGKLASQGECQTSSLESTCLYKYEKIQVGEHVLPTSRLQCMKLSKENKAKVNNMIMLCPVIIDMYKINFDCSKSKPLFTIDHTDTS